MGRMAENEREVYNAVMKENGERVIELCRKFQEGPLRIITIHKDTVLHMASYTEQAELVLHLLRELPENNDPSKMMGGNDVGNTILHEAATSSKLVDAAREMLRRAPDLLTKENKYGDTALFLSVRYGNTVMFNFLQEELKKNYRGKALKNCYRKEDKTTNTTTTILHESIIAAQFDLALQIAYKCGYLVREEDSDGLTCLQHLSRDETTFGNSGRKYLMHFINSFSSSWILPLSEAVRKEVKRYDSPLKLAKLLIERDTSWKNTEQLVGDREVGEASSSSLQHEEENSEEKSIDSNKSDTATSKFQTPLLLATQHGCVEIVKEILARYPQAVEHVDKNGSTILHIAIQYRQIGIFDMLQNTMTTPIFKRLVRKCDNDSNSILHMVASKAEDCRTEDTQSPALKLQKELLLFERVQSICSAHFFRHINKNKDTAEKIFADKNHDLHESAKDWFKRTAENSSIVAVLIATVAFAAAYTVPGGSDDKTGVPILIKQPFFVLFTITEVLSLTFALTSVILFLSILTSPFRLNDFKRSLPTRLTLGFTCLIFSVSMMMFAFAATVILMIHDREQWTKVALYTAAFLPVCIFAFSYLPLYSSLLKTLKSSLDKIMVIFSPSSCLFKSRESKISIPSNPVQTQATNSSCLVEPQTTRSLV